MTEIIVSDTNEISEIQWIKYADSFNTIFDKNFDIPFFKRKYAQSCLNYSLHAFLNVGDLIVGSLTIIPAKYLVKNQEFLFGLKCDAFVFKDYRSDEFILKKMHDALIKRAAGLGIIFTFSIPNPIALPYWKIMSKYKEIGSLDYYIIPLHLNKVLKKYNWLKHLSRPFAKLIVDIAHSINFSNSRSTNTIRLKKDKEFISKRYDNTYTVNFDKKEYYVLKQYVEDDLKVVYIIDVFPLTGKMITKAAKYAVREFQEADILMFIGKTQSNLFPFVKVPVSKEPRKLSFIGKSIQTTEVSESLFNINNWELCLADFDNR